MFHDSHHLSLMGFVNLGKLPRESTASAPLPDLGIVPVSRLITGTSKTVLSLHEGKVSSDFPFCKVGEDPKDAPAQPEISPVADDLITQSYGG